MLNLEKIWRWYLSVFSKIFISEYWSKINKKILLKIARSNFLLCSNRRQSCARRRVRAMGHAPGRDQRGEREPCAHGPARSASALVGAARARPGLPPQRRRFNFHGRRHHDQNERGQRQERAHWVRPAFKKKKVIITTQLSKASS